MFNFAFVRSISIVADVVYILNTDVNSRFRIRLGTSGSYALYSIRLKGFFLLLVKNSFRLKSDELLTFPIFI